MTATIFKRMMLVVLLTFAACLALGLHMLYTSSVKNQSESLQTQAESIAGALASEGSSYLETVRSDAVQVTWFDQDGTVLFHHGAEDPSSDFAEQEEIRQAAEAGTGEEIRYSEALSQTVHYYAMRLEDGTILRVCRESVTVWSLFLRFMRSFGLILVLMTALVGLLALNMSKSITRPINSINWEHPEESLQYEEFAPLTGRINRQNALISDQMREMIAQQEKFRVLTDNMREGLILTDSTGLILSYNQAALRLLGQQAQATDDIFSLNNSESFCAAIQSVFRGTHVEWTFEVGDSVCQMIANPVMDGAAVNGAVLLLMDVTERERRETLRREFTSNVSHELKTPMTSIYGIADMLAGGMVQEQDVPHFSAKIRDESARLIALIEDIIRVSQLDENSFSQEKEKLDLYDTAQNVMQQLEAAAKRMHVSIRLEGTSAFVHSVPVIVEEMIYNLCDNAIKYNVEGGSVVITVEPSEQWSSVCISDTGIGIPLSEQDRIFERFYRVDKSHSKAIGGTGLGLSIVKHGAAYHNARIHLESELGRGTSITVEFPAEA